MMLRHWKNKQNVSLCAKYQSKGIGQGRNSWESGEGGLYYSIKLHNSVPVHVDSKMIAEMVQKEIKKISNINTTIKPPNDIYYNGKKLAGVLVESEVTLSASTTDVSIIGVGININQEKFSEGLNAIAICQLIKTKQDLTTYRMALDKLFSSSFISD